MTNGQVPLAKLSSSWMNVLARESLRDHDFSTFKDYCNYVNKHFPYDWSDRRFLEKHWAIRHGDLKYYHMVQQQRLMSDFTLDKNCTERTIKQIEGFGELI